MKQNVIYFLLFLASANITLAQDCNLLPTVEWEFITWEPAPEPQTEFFIECNVSNFINVASFRFTLNFDHTNLEFVSIDNIGNPLNGDVFVSDAGSVLDNGYLPTGWINLDGQGETIDDGTICRIWFKIIGDPQNCYDWVINSDIAEMEVVQRLENGIDCFKDKINFRIGEGCMCSSLFLLNSTCPNQLELSACGGEAPYTYAIAGPGGEFVGTLTENQTESFDNLAAGAYSALIQDDAFNQYTTIFEVPSSNLVSVVDATVCNNDEAPSSTILDLSTNIQSSLPFTIIGPTGETLETNIVDFIGVPIGLYEYTFVVGDELCGLENYISTIEVQNCTITSNKNTAQKIPEIFPNPSQGTFNISSEQNLHASVYDLNGKLILQTNIETGNNELILKDNNAGLYFIKYFEAGEMVGVQKLILQ